MSKKIKRGRPAKDKASRATSFIQLRVTERRKAAYQRAAKDQPLARWIFANLDSAASYES
jgi:hypothetical protein